MLSVVLGEVNGQKVLLGQQFGVSVMLDWLDDPLQPDLFQISGRGMLLPYAALSGGTLGEYVEFLRTHVAAIGGLKIEGLFPGVIFNKL